MSEADLRDKITNPRGIITDLTEKNEEMHAQFAALEKDEEWLHRWGPLPTDASVGSSLGMARRSATLDEGQRRWEPQGETLPTDGSDLKKAL